MVSMVSIYIILLLFSLEERVSMILKIAVRGVYVFVFIHEFGIGFCQNRIVIAMVFIFTGRSCFHLAGLVFLQHVWNHP